MKTRLQSVITILILTFLLLTLANPAQARPGLQEGEDTPTEEETPPDGNSTGDTLDLTQQKNNLGVIMSGNTEPDDDDDENDTDTDIDADDPEADDPAGDTEDEEAAEDAVQQHPVANAIARFFDAPYDEVFGLHEEGNGFGNIAKAYFFSSAIGVLPGELLSKVKSKGWGNVLKENDIHPGSVGNGKNKNNQDNDETVEAATTLQSKGQGAPSFAGPGNNNGGGNGNGNANGHDKNKGNNGNNGNGQGNNGKAKGKN